MGPEAKLYKKIKKATPTISWNRIENLSIPGMPDALCYNKYNTFFTVEFKVTKSNKLRLSPHQSQKVNYQNFLNKEKWN